MKITQNGAIGLGLVPFLAQFLTKFIPISTLYSIPNFTLVYYFIVLIFSAGILTSICILFILFLDNSSLPEEKLSNLKYFAITNIIALIIGTIGSLFLLAYSFRNF